MGKKVLVIVQIIKCSHENYWYSKHVGRQFEAIKETIDSLITYRVSMNNTKYRGCWIQNTDCVDISEEMELSTTITDFNELENQHSSILLEANSIVNGERNEQYGDAKEAFSVYAEICNTAFGLNVSPDDVCKVLMAVKLGRLKYKYKRDSIVDLCGYAEILSKLNEG